MKVRHLMVGGIVVLVSIIIDQFTKMLALAYLDPLASDTKVVIDGFFQLRLTYNTGAAWSSFSGNMPFLIGITLISIVAFAFFFRSVDFIKKFVYSTGISLMFGGLFGNFIDRLFLEKVVDFLDFNIFTYDFPVFNIADICLVVGVFLFVIDLLFLEGKRKNEKI